MEFEAYHSGSTGNLYRVKSGSNSILIEAGVPIRRIRQALNFSLGSVSGVLISHSHGDHSKSARDIAKAGIDCFMTAETAGAINANGHRTRIIEPLKQFEIAGFSILPFQTQHDCPGSVGFLISDGLEKLLFATDTFYVRYKFKSLNIVAVECNWSKKTLSPDLDPIIKRRLYRSHFSLENVKNFLLANDLRGVREIHLVHLSNDNSNQRFFKNEIERLTGKPTYIAPQ